MGIFAGIKVAISAGKKIAEIVPIARAVLSKTEADPITVTTTEKATFDVASLYRSFKAKHDSDGDGKSDWTPQEAMEFLAQVLTLVSKYV